MSPRATHWAALYHLFSSRGAFGVTVSFKVTAVSTCDVIRMRLSSSFLYFRRNALPSFVFALTIILLVFLPCDTISEESGISTTSFSKLRLFFGKASSFSLPFLTFSLLSRPAGLPFCCLFLFRNCVERETGLCVLLKRSLAFLRNGTWL